MSELGNKQHTFALNFAFLILEAEKRGFSVSIGDVFRAPAVFGEVGVKQGYGHRSSLHKLKLAGDLNLFSGDVYIKDATGHRALHDWWVTMGGNPMIEDDPNHYSWPYNNMR